MQAYADDAKAFARAYLATTKLVARLVDQQIEVAAVNQRGAKRREKARRAIRRAQAGTANEGVVGQLGELALTLVTLSTGALGVLVAVQSAASVAEKVLTGLSGLKDIAEGEAAVRAHARKESESRVNGALLRANQHLSVYADKLGGCLEALVEIVGADLQITAALTQSIVGSRLESLASGFVVSAACGPDYPRSFTSRIQGQIGAVELELGQGAAIATRAAATSAAAEGAGVQAMRQEASVRSLFDRMYDVGLDGELVGVCLEHIERLEVGLKGYEPIPTESVADGRMAYYVTVRSRPRPRTTELVVPAGRREELAERFPELSSKVSRDAVRPGGPRAHRFELTSAQAAALGALPAVVVAQVDLDQLDLRAGGTVLSDRRCGLPLSTWWETELLADAVAHGPLPFVHHAAGALVGVEDRTTSEVHRPEWLDAYR